MLGPGRSAQRRTVAADVRAPEIGLSPGLAGDPSGDACRTLAAQREPLETWIDEPTEENPSFIIAGDFNGRIDRFGPQDHLWQAIDDGDPPPLDLIRFPEGIDSPCVAGTPDHRTTAIVRPRQRQRLVKLVVEQNQLRAARMRGDPWEPLGKNEPNR